MESRLAIIGIFVEDNNASLRINQVLHDFSEVIVGRMGLPYKNKNIGVISIIIDAPNNTISNLSGKLGMIEGVSVKTMFSKVTASHE